MAPDIGSRVRLQMTAPNDLSEKYRRLLQLGASFNLIDLRKAYGQMILKWHPDRNGASEEASSITKQLNAANAYLVDLLNKIGGCYSAGTTASENPHTRRESQRPKWRATSTEAENDAHRDEIPLVSSHLRSTKYDEPNRLLYLTFANGARYVYFGVPKSVFEGLLQAPSHGKYANRFIYHSYRYKGVR